MHFSVFKDRRIRTSLVAISADLLSIGIKGGSAWITGSMALAADALHSITDLLVSLLVLVGLLFRRRQESSSQSRFSPQQLQKAESIIAIFVALLILAIPVEIIREINSQGDQKVEHIWVGILAVLAVIAIAYIMSRLKIMVGRSSDSPSLEADGYHSQMDVFTSVAVLFSLIGQLIGIYLDNIIAVIIAVIVFLVGIELLVSAIRSLSLGDGFKQISLMAGLEHKINTSAFAKPIRGKLSQAWQLCRRPSSIGLFFFLLSLAYLATGLTQVPAHAIGVKERMGAIVDANLPPGLHYHWPAPFERIFLLTDGEVKKLKITTHTQIQQTNPNTKLWQQEVITTRSQNENTNHLVTGDENLADLELSIHYQIQNPAEVWRQSHNIAAILFTLAESAMRREAAATEFEQLLGDHRQQFAIQIQNRLNHDLSEINLPVKIVGTYLTIVQPAAATVSAYREIANARQEHLRVLLAAQAERLYDLPIAQSERAIQEAQAYAQSSERRLHALGDAERLKQLAEVTLANPDAVAFNRYMDSIAKTLADKPLMISDPDIDFNDPRIWRVTRQFMEQSSR